MTRVHAPNRLHFGLLSLPLEHLQHWPGLDGQPGLPMRHFGGVGLMVAEPGVRVRVTLADDWQHHGDLSARALVFAQNVVQTLPPHERRAFRIDIEQTPGEHLGLGVGTQLGLATAKAIALELNHPEWTATELAVRVGRGERSAIGVHGFAHGGLIVEGGKHPAEAISPLITHMAFPPDWCVLLAIPEPTTNWHGQRERQAFAKLSKLAPTPHETETLCRLMMMHLLPAIASHNLDAFGDALYEFNARVGDIFAPAQGGRYGSPAIAACVRQLRTAGLRGVGQSSWGPTVFAIIPRADAAYWLKQLDCPTWVAHASTGMTAERSPR